MSDKTPWLFCLLITIHYSFVSSFFSCCFSMILSPSENKALAENVLSLIIRYLLQTFKHFDQTEEVRFSNIIST